MADFLREATLSNLVTSTILAAIAWAVQRQVREPSLTNLLWARHQLRIFEERACDDRVLETSNLEISQSANGLLNMAELFAATAIRPPAVASAFNSGGSLEKRLNVMLAATTWKAPAVLRLMIVAFATCMLPLGLTDAQDFKSVEQRLGGAVEAGELTLEQASLMMNALRRSTVTREMQQNYRAFAQKVEEAVKAGKLSKADAEDKLIEAQREMFKQRETSKQRDMSKQREMSKQGGKQERGYDLTARKQRYAMLAGEIEKQVKAGKLSKADAEKKLIEVRRELFENHGNNEQNRNMEAKKRRYMMFAKEIEEQVEAGNLSKADAEEKLIEMRRKMFENQGKKEQDRSMEARKQRYMMFAEEIEKEVKAGNLSKAEAEEKLIEMRREMFENQGKKEQGRNMEARKQRYMKFAEEIEEQVKAGTLSKADAEEKLVEAKRELLGAEEAEEEEEDEDECDDENFDDDFDDEFEEENEEVEEDF